jgi:IclR family pca regulon transcriptional regulator
LQRNFAIRKSERKQKTMTKGARSQPAAKSAAVKPSKMRRRGVKRTPAAAFRGADGRENRNVIVSSLVKGLRVLEAFSAERAELTLSDVAALTKLDPGTVFRLLNTLIMLGYVDRAADRRSFRLTLKVTDLGLHAIARADLRQVARPILRSLVGEINEAASLGVLDGADIIYIERVRAGLARVSVDIRIGTTIPAFWSTIGEAMLAFLPKAELDKVLSLKPRIGSFPLMSMNRDEITRRLRRVRADGYSLRDSYFGSGLRILAVPVLDVDGYPLAAVSVAVPQFRLSEKEFLAGALGALHRATNDIARAIQASGTVSVV